MSELSADKRLIGLEEASKVLGISRPTLYRKIKNKDFSLIKIGRRSLISYEEILGYIEKLRLTTGGENA